MTSDIVIRAERLGKKYIIGHQTADRSTTFRDVITQNVKNFVRGAKDMAQGKAIVAGDELEEFWALKDVNFEIKRGDVVGIIGRNGAGKSTLLKVLSRITEPTEGRVEIKGRVASLLEVGTGFHPELSGRENVYLNGAILGMTRAEINRKFDEIVDFSGVEKFLDTPVKRYSSGMYVRLAFAVAAHLEPEILVVDEVLAVGDAEFQKKCLGKMQDVAGQGRTVLFVSHNMGAVNNLCSVGVLMADGRSIYSGPAGSVIDKYSNSMEMAYDLSFSNEQSKPRFTRLKIDENALKRGCLIANLWFSSPAPMQTPIGGIILRSLSGEPVWGSNGRFHERDTAWNGGSEGILTCESGPLPIRPGQYLVSIWLGDWQVDYESRIDVMKIALGLESTDSFQPPVSVVGYVDCAARWRTDPLDVIP